MSTEKNANPVSKDCKDRRTPSMTMHIKDPDGRFTAIETDLKKKIERMIESELSQQKKSDLGSLKNTARKY